MPQVRFEPTFPAFERANVVHASGRKGTVIAYLSLRHDFGKRFGDERFQHSVSKLRDRAL
jgi:hypothetical protein